MVSVLVKMKNSYVRGKEEGKQVLDNILAHAIFLDPVLVTVYQDTGEEGCQYAVSRKHSPAGQVPTAPSKCKVMAWTEVSPK